MRLTIKRPRPRPHDNRYASARTFRALFELEMSPIFELAFLLTADVDLAKECLSAALEDCLRTDSVFRESALSYARYAVIKRAIGAHRDLSRRSAGIRSHCSDTERREGIRGLNLLFRLTWLERVVLVLCLLERRSPKEASILLRTTTEEVRRARMRVLEHLRRSPLPTSQEAAWSLAR